MHSPVVLGLPRGGVVVAAKLAEALGAPLDVLVARKVGTPGREELGIGAIAEGLDEPIVSGAAREMGVTAGHIRRLAERGRAELDRRVARYRADRPLPEMADRDVVVVDDGLATGVTAEAALHAVRDHHPKRLVLAVPVCAAETAERLGSLADEIVCAETPEPFFAVGQWYENFDQVSDDEVVELLARWHAPRSAISRREEDSTNANVAGTHGAERPFDNPVVVTGARYN